MYKYACQFNGMPFVCNNLRLIVIKMSKMCEFHSTLCRECIVDACVLILSDRCNILVFIICIVFLPGKITLL